VRERKKKKRKGKKEDHESDGKRRSVTGLSSYYEKRNLAWGKAPGNARSEGKRRVSSETPKAGVRSNAIEKRKGNGRKLKKRGKYEGRDRGKGANSGKLKRTWRKQEKMAVSKTTSKFLRVQKSSSRWAR